MIEALEPEAPLVLDGSTPTALALQQLLDAHGHCLVVESDEWVLGLVTLGDLQRAISAGGSEQPVAACRRSELLWLPAGASLAALEDQLRPNGLRQLPVFALQEQGLPKLPHGLPGAGLRLHNAATTPNHHATSAACQPRTHIGGDGVDVPEAR